MTHAYHARAKDAAASRFAMVSMAYAPRIHSAGRQNRKYRRFQEIVASSMVHTPPSATSVHQRKERPSRWTTDNHAPNSASASVGVPACAAKETSTGVGLPVLDHPRTSGSR